MVRVRRSKRTCFHAQTLERRKETSQLDYIIGPMRRNDEEYIHNDERTWTTWDHYSEEVDWMETEDRRANNGIQEKVIEKNYDTEDDLATIQRNIEIAAGKVAHHTKAEGEKS